MAAPDAPGFVEQMEMEPHAGDGHQVALLVEQLEADLDKINPDTQVVNVAPTKNHQLGTFTVFCFMTNRTIASGIFTQPANVLFITGSSGVALMLWIVGGFVTLGILACWNELAQTIPMHKVRRGTRWVRISTPRSGADKNWVSFFLHVWVGVSFANVCYRGQLEYIFKKPQFWMTSTFGMLFIMFGNLASNALQFGIFMQTAVDPGCSEGDKCFKKGAAVGWAIFAISITCFVNIFTRRFTILINNAYAVLKVTMLVVITITGLVYGSKNNNSCSNISFERKAPGGGFGGIALALVYATFPYGGYEQPFYVHAEVRSPRRKFVRTTTYTLLVVIVLFTLVNVSYLCVVPYHDIVPANMNMAVQFFERVAGEKNSQATAQGISALLGFFLLGNMTAECFTSTRVKQEIGKEGVFPFSLWLAKSSDTLLARWASRRRKADERMTSEFARNHAEQAPIAATFLHWLTEIILVLIFGVSFEPSYGYRFLSFLKVFVIVLVLGLFTVGGLLYLKIDSWIRAPRSRRWNEKVQQHGRPWLDPLPSIFAFVALLYMVFGVFVPPVAQRPGETYWVKPLVGIAFVFAGTAWWLGLRGYLWHSRLRLLTIRLPYIEFNRKGNAVQRAEFVEVRVVPED